MDVRWRVQLLGGLSVARAGAVVSSFRTQKTAAVLAYLALRREGPTPREVLLELFWPDGEPEAARNNLSKALSALRRVLEPPGVAAGTVVLARRSTVEIDRAALTSDVVELEEAIERARRARAEEQVRDLRTAVGLYRGDLLPGHEAEWVAVERARLRAVFLRATHELVVSLERSRELEEAKGHARRAIGLDPLGEQASADLMRLEIASGARVEATRIFRELCRRLDRELGARPSAETCELARRAEHAPGRVPSLAAPVAAPPGPPAPSLPPASALPRGTVTFLVAASTGPGALERLEAEVARHRGHGVVRDDASFLAAFERPTDALACAVACGPARLRFALDAGEVDLDESDDRDRRAALDRYHGPVLARVAALAAAAEPGQVLALEPFASLVRDGGKAARSLVDLGVFHLAGESRSQRVYTLGGGPGLEAPGAALRDRRVLSGSLPLELNPIFGRSDDVAEIRDALTRRGVRLLTITGPGGIGKTRLATELVLRLVEDFPGAVAFVPLADTPHAQLLPAAIASALGLAPSPRGDPLERSIEALARGPSLLVFDNLEQIADGSAPIVTTLLHRVPSLAVLVTSRRSVGIPGEHEYPLGPLPLPEEPFSIQISELASVRTFVDRARAARPDFRIDRSNAATIGGS